MNREEKFLIEELCEHPALSKQGPEGLPAADLRRDLPFAIELAGIASRTIS